MKKNIEVLNIRLEELKNYIVAKVNLENYDKKSFQMFLATDKYVLERLSVLKENEVSEFLDQINALLPNAIKETSKFSAIDDLVYELYCFLVDLSNKNRINETEYQYFCELLDSLSFSLSHTTRNEDMILQLKPLIPAMCEEVIEKENPFTHISNAVLDCIDELPIKEYDKLSNNYKPMNADLLEFLSPVIKEIGLFEKEMEVIFLPSNKSLATLLDDMLELQKNIKEIIRTYKLSKKLKQNFHLFITKVDDLKRLFQNYSFDLSGYEFLKKMSLEERKEFLDSFYEILNLQKETFFSKLKHDSKRKKEDLKSGFCEKKNSFKEKIDQLKKFSKENKVFTFPKDKQDLGQRKADICSYKFYLEGRKVVGCENLTGEVLEKYQKALKRFSKKYNSVSTSVDGFTVSAFCKVQTTLKSLKEFQTYFPYSQDTNMKKYLDNLLLSNDLTEEEYKEKLKHLNIIVKNAESYISMLEDQNMKIRLLRNYRESIRLKRVGMAAILALGIFGFKGHKNSNEILEPTLNQNESYIFLKETPSLSTEFSLGSFEEEKIDIPDRLNLDLEVSSETVLTHYDFTNAFEKMKNYAINSTQASKKENEQVRKFSFVSNFKRNVDSFVKKFGKTLTINHKIVEVLESTPSQNESYTFLKETPSLSTEFSLESFEEDKIDIPDRLNLDPEVSSEAVSTHYNFTNAFERMKNYAINSIQVSKKENEQVRKLSFVSNLKRNVDSFVKKFGKTLIINHKIISQESEFVPTDIPTTLFETPQKEVSVIETLGNLENSTDDVLVPKTIRSIEEEKVPSKYLFNVVGNIKKKASDSIVKIKENSEKKKLKAELSMVRQNLLKLRENLNISYDEDRLDIQPGSIVRSVDENLTLYTDIYSLNEQKNGRNAYYDEKEHLVESVVLEKDGNLKNVKDVSLMDEYEKLGYERIGYTLMNQYSLLEFEGEGRCTEDSVTLIR